MKGYDAIYEEFDKQFGELACCGADIEELCVEMEGNLGIVNTVQHFWCEPKGWTEKEWLYTRQTDIYRKKDGEWKLIEQHISMCLNDR